MTYRRGIRALEIVNIPRFGDMQRDYAPMMEACEFPTRALDALTSLCGSTMGG